MAVYDRTFKRYKGPITAPTWRFLVLARYVFKDVFKSRLLVFFYAICFLPTLLAGAWVYLVNNLELVQMLDVAPRLLEEMRINAERFQQVLNVQYVLAFVLTLFVGPGLISRDLNNNGLPLYLSRPISRVEYLVGKFSVLFILLSSITWVPDLLLFGLQASLEEGWASQNLRIPFAVVASSCAWIFLLGVSVLALSAWVKWRVLAAFMMLAIYAIASPFSWVINLLFQSRSDLGYLINPWRLIEIVGSWLFGTPIPDGPPVAVAWLALAAMAGTFLLLLHWKLRAYEVVS